MRLFPGLFFVLVILSMMALKPYPASANSCDDTAVINLSFEYQAGFKLPGVNVDREAYQVFLRDRQATELHLQGLSDPQIGGGGKKALLELLKKKTEGKGIVQFNYLGHGIQPIDAKKARAATSAYHDQLANIANTRKKNITLLDLQVLNGEPTADEDILKLRALKKEADESQDKFAIATPECMSCKSECAASCRQECRQKKGDERFSCESLCSDDFSTSCQQSCLEKVCITSSDLDQVFAGKKVYGVVDACYAGGLKEMNHKNFAFLGDTLTLPMPDSENGGLVKQVFLDNLKGRECSADTNGDGAISLEEFHKFGRVNSQDPDRHRIGVTAASSEVSSDPAFSCLINLSSFNCQGSSQQPGLPVNPNGGVR